MARRTLRIEIRYPAGWGGKGAGRKGAVFDDRFHQQIMKSPRQVRNGLCYVLQNARRHVQELPRWANGIDPYSVE